MKTTRTLNKVHLEGGKMTLTLCEKTNGMISKE
jgi:hypothetical protein